MSDDKVMFEWQGIMLQLTELELLIESDEPEKWTVALPKAQKLNESFKAFFALHNPLSNLVMENIALDKGRVVAVMSAMLDSSANQKKVMGKEITGFLQGQKGIKAYKKV